MIDLERQERNVAETAYCFRVLEYYGSESKAVLALLKRKGMDKFDRKTAMEALTEELTLLDRTESLIKAVLQRANKNYHPQLTAEQFDAGTEFIRGELAKLFPKLTRSIDYMIAMLWHMPRVR